MGHDEPRWRRRDGAWVTLGELKLDELREARRELLHRDLAVPGTVELFEAVNAAIERYGHPDESDPDAWREAA